MHHKTCHGILLTVCRWPLASGGLETMPADHPFIWFGAAFQAMNQDHRGVERISWNVASGYLTGIMRNEPGISWLASSAVKVPGDRIQVNVQHKKVPFFHSPIEPSPLGHSLSDLRNFVRIW